jgi:CRP-like cAMP-binding protein
MTDNPAQKAREAARSVEAAGLLPEADILYRLAETLEGQDRAAASASLARILLAAGHVDQARPFALDGDDPVLVARLRLEAHDFADARRLLDDARARDPFDPRIASACGRLAFLEKRFAEAVESLLEAALLRNDGLPDSADRRFLRAARALAPAEIPPWKDAVAAARDRLAREAAARAPSAPWPDHSAPLLRSLIRRGDAGGDGILDRARRLAEMPALEGLDEGALFAAAAAGELRRLASGSVLFRAGEPSREISLIVQGALELARETPVGEQPMGEAAAGDLVGEEALLGAPRCSDARAKGPATLLGFTADFFAAEPERAGWLRHLRARLARRLARRNDLFKQFFPDAPAGAPAPAAAEAPRPSEELSLEDRSRSLGTVGLSESDRFLFAVFAEEKHCPAGTVIFREGNSGDAIYVVARGRVRISRQISGGEEAFAILGPGEIFGEMALLDPGSGRSADARAHEESVVLELSRERFDALEASDPEGCAELSALLCRLAARRCMETAERLATWRVMAGPA